MSTDLEHSTVGTPNREADDRMSVLSTLAHQAVTAVPKLVISDRLRKADKYDPSKQYEFRYRAKGHRDLSPRCQVVWRTLKRDAPVRAP